MAQDALEDTADREEEPFESQASADVPAVPAQTAKAEPVVAAALPPEPAPREPGEFTRFFQGGAPASKPQAPPAPVQRPEPPPLAEVPAQKASSGAEPGEFTRQFLAASSTPTQPIPPEPRREPVSKPAAPPPPVSPPKSEPGEFTRMFNAQTANKPAPPEPPRNAERPSNPDLKGGQDRFSKTGFVQRPSTPLPGEFTRLFSQASGESEAETKSAYAAPPPPRSPSAEPDFGSRNTGSSDPFWRTPDSSNADLGPAPAKEPGEYTRMFGAGSNPQGAEPKFTASPGPPPPRTFDDPLNATTPLMPAVTTPPVPKGPSEWTRIMQSNRPPQNAATNAPQPSAGGGAPPPPGAPPFAMPPLNVSMPPAPNPMQAMHMPAPGAAAPPAPHMAMPAMPAPPALKAPAMPAMAPVAVANPNKKLLILLAVLGVLALLLVVLVVLTLKK